MLANQCETVGQYFLPGEHRAWLFPQFCPLLRIVGAADKVEVSEDVDEFVELVLTELEEDW